MPAKKTQITASLESLLRQLPLFGLNPEDWECAGRAHNSEVEVRHRHDFDFRLQASVGRKKNGEWKLRRLSLASL